VPAAIRKQTGIGAHNAKKRDVAQLTQGVREWVEAKFNQPGKMKLKQDLCAGDWTKELVVGRIKHEEELDLLSQAGLKVHRLKDILAGMADRSTVVKAAAGTDLCDLMLMGK
jgi:hypothetical protein